MDHGWLDAIGCRQHGLVTGTQVRVVWSDPQVEDRVRRRLLMPARPGVYRLPGVPRTWRQDVLAVCLSYAGTTAASHRCAARLWRLEVPSLRIEVTVAPGRSGRMAEVMTHRATLGVGDRTERYGIPVTSPERTLIDLTAVAADSTLERALDDALRQGHTTIENLAGRLVSLPAGGWRRSGTLRRLVDERRAGYRPGDSHWEDRICRWIVRAGLPVPERQCWVVVGGQRRCLDLAYPGPRIAIEYDGWDTHRLRRHFDDDRARTIDLQLAGWLVLPFTSRSTPADVVDKVGRALAKRSHPPRH